MVVISKQNLDYSVNSGLNDRQPNISFPETTAKAAYMNILNQQARASVDLPSETNTEEQEVDIKAKEKRERKAKRMKEWEMKKAFLKNKKKKRKQTNNKKKETVENIIDTIKKDEDEKEKKAEEDKSQLNLDTDSPDELIDANDEKVREFLESVANLFDEEMVEEIAKKTGLVKRKSKLTGHLFLTIFTFGMNIYSSPTLNQLVGLLDLVAAVDISRQAFFNRIKPEAVAFFSHMLSPG